MASRRWVGKPLLQWEKDLAGSTSLKNLFLILVVILIVFSGLYFIYRQSHNPEIIASSPTRNLEGVAGSSAAGQNLTALNYAKKILSDAREIYLKAIKENKTQAWCLVSDSFTEEFILNATFINESTISIGHSLYKYLILYVYYEGFDYSPQKIKANGIEVELLPKPSTVTYTGGQIYNYRVTYNIKTYNATLYSIGIVESSFYLTGSTRKIDNLYIIKITTTKKLGSTKYINELWLILIRS